MKTRPDCIPCILNKVLATARAVDNNEWLLRRVMAASMKVLSDAEFDMPPAAVAAECLKKTHEVLGVHDPFQPTREEQNRLALAFEPTLREALEASSDPFGLAVRLAAVGNEVQVCFRDVLTLPQLLARARATPWTVSDLEELREDVDKAQTVLYVLNNSGELVFDKLLMAEIAKKQCQITAAVGLSQFLNRATLAGTEATDLESVCEVLDFGGVAGARLPLQSTDFQKRYREADVVIVKGQANYGSFVGQERGAYFLMSVKCPCYAFDLGVSQGDLVLTKR